MKIPGESYIDNLRRLVGKGKLIVPAARAIIQNQSGEVLLVCRRDNLRWGLPTGGLEIGESIFQCLAREVQEETGLKVISVIPIAIYSEPRFEYKDTLGDEYQLFCVVFWVEEWEGNLITATDETVEARFFPLDNLPDIAANQLETLGDLKKYQGRLILK